VNGQALKNYFLVTGNNVMLNGQAFKIIFWLLEFMPGWMAMLRKLIYELMG
jgi:hypothetical protein